MEYVRRKRKSPLSTKGQVPVQTDISSRGSSTVYSTGGLNGLLFSRQFVPQLQSIPYPKLPEYLRGVADIRMILYSLLIIGLMMARPQGLFTLSPKKATSA